ncbi:hypothetical protein PIB30_024852 [Stylosanthes scabra]|uniref:Uncharacterized protein n=1 Tax=Stylosanthes scabra TaxID=79078 RepID=A0ABU6ZBG2_9FABA|nr:hypothetical protein [Stylosanthes scabra]
MSPQSGASIVEEIDTKTLSFDSRVVDLEDQVVSTCAGKKRVMGSSDEESENQFGGSFTGLHEGEEGDSGEDDIGEGSGWDAAVDEEFGNDFYDDWHERGVDGIAELGQINLKEIGVSEIKKLHFPDQNVAFSFFKL